MPKFLAGFAPARHEGDGAPKSANLWLMPPHARAWRGHPRFEGHAEVEIVDGRAKPGHDNCLRPTPTLVMPAKGIHDLLIDRLVVGQFESRSPP